MWFQINENWVVFLSFTTQFQKYWLRECISIVTKLFSMRFKFIWAQKENKWFLKLCKCKCVMFPLSVIRCNCDKFWTRPRSSSNSLKFLKIKNWSSRSRDMVHFFRYILFHNCHSRMRAFYCGLSCLFFHFSENSEQKLKENRKESHQFFFLLIYWFFHINVTIL